MVREDERGGDGGFKESQVCVSARRRPPPRVAAVAPRNVVAALPSTKKKESPARCRLELLRRARLGLGALRLRQQDGVDVRQHAAGGDGDRTQQLVQLLVVANGKLHVARDDARLLVVAGGVARELENLSAEVLEHSGQVDRSADADARGRALEEAVDPPHREL
eukprot:SAG11_NODE_1565_length_4673_cov_9.494972_1_plen_164_part_00